MNENLRRIGLTHLYAILDRLDETELGPPDVWAGECGECGEEARNRWSFGAYVLCRNCRRNRRRARVSERLAAGAPGPPTEPPPLAETLIAQASRNGHSEEPIW